MGILKQIVRYVVRWALSEDLKQISKAIAESSKNAEFNSERLNRVANSVIVGADVHEHPADRSWAVVCIRGEKEDAVRFVELSNAASIRDINMFLRKFQSDPYVDATPTTTRYIKTTHKWEIE